MSKKRIPAGAVVRGTDKGYVHGDLKPGGERPVDKFEQKYPYMRPRDAATLILVRERGKIPEVLMGCRDAKHAFMPNRYVFPGGRVDRADAHVPIATPLDRHVKARLLKAATALRAQALGVAAVRETFEETGLMLAKPLKNGAPGKDYGEHWKGFLDKGMAPALDKLEAFASLNGPRFYGLPANEERITLQAKPLEAPERIEVPGGNKSIVVFRPDTPVGWSL